MLLAEQNHLLMEQVLLLNLLEQVKRGKRGHRDFRGLQDFRDFKDILVSKDIKDTLYLGGMLILQNIIAFKLLHQVHKVLEEV